MQFRTDVCEYTKTHYIRSSKINIFDTAIKIVYLFKKKRK